MKDVTMYANFTDTVGNISVSEIIVDIQRGKYKLEIERIREESLKGNKKRVSALKKSLLAFTPSGTFEKGKRNASAIVSYNQYVILDIDNLSKNELEEVRGACLKSSYTHILFVSPSGKGLKIIVWVSSGQEHHKMAYEQVRSYYEGLLGVEVDSSGSDICRLCFVSYDPNLYCNAFAEVFPVRLGDMLPEIESRHAPAPVQLDGGVESYIQAIENSGTDITGDYQTWCKLGFAFSEVYGEAGREYYHRISRFHPNYNYQECDKQFSYCLKSNGSGVTMATFYYLAHLNNIKPFKMAVEKESLAIPQQNTNKEQTDTPAFSTSLIPQFPQFLQDVVKYAGTDQEKDIMILGAITAISACLPKLFGIYDGDKVFSNLYLFITAAAASGKGKLKFCKRLVHKIHTNMLEETKLMEAEYDKDLAHYNKNKGKNDSAKKPQKPPIRMLFIPANNSSTGMFQLLSESKGRGLIFETEADTLAKNFKTDYGDYSDGFRNAFHHETIKYFRRTDREYVEIDQPCLSCVLTGTPKQVLALMPNAENGLFSRFMLYNMPTTTGWKNVFAIDTKKGLNGYYDQLGNQFYELYRHLMSNPEIQFSYTPEQQERFNEFFSKINLYYLNVNPIEYNSSIKRTGIIAFRISMVLSALRIMETGDVSNPLYCTEEDFKTTLAMVKVLIKHSSKVYSSLPEDKMAINYKNKKEQFIEGLPHRFTTQDYMVLANRLSITQKTAERYITNLCKSNFLIREAHGHYINPSKDDDEES